MVFDLLLVFLSVLLDQTLLQPVLESFVAFLLLDLLVKAFSLFLTKLTLLLDGFSDQLGLFPFVHAMSTFLVLFI